mgnify:FL=1
MTGRAEPARRRRWPLLLISLLLVLLALGGVVTAQLYWSGLRTGVEQMRASVTAAQQEQQRLMARVKAAEAALAERVAALAVAADSGPSDGQAAAPQGGAVEGPAAPAQPGAARLRRNLSPAERAELGARLEALARDAARLPPARTRRQSPRASAASKQLLREQLAVAAAAAAADDLVLLDAALTAAQRLAGAPHRPADRPGAVMAAELAALRARLWAVTPARTAPTAPGAAPAR